MGALLAVLPIFQTALSAISAFKGSAQVATTTGYIQDAVAVVAALSPLVRQFGDGHEVTQADVDAALAGMDAKIKGLDDLIAARGG